MPVATRSEVSAKLAIAPTHERDIAGVKVVRPDARPSSTATGAIARPQVRRVARPWLAPQNTLFIVQGFSVESYPKSACPVYDDEFNPTRTNYVIRCFTVFTTLRA